MFKVDVIRKGFRRPKDIPIFFDPNLSTFRGGSDGDDSPDRSTTFATTNIKTAGGFKKKRSAAPESQIDSIASKPNRSMSSRNKAGLGQGKESRSKQVRSRSRSVKSQKSKAITTKKPNKTNATSAVSIQEEANQEIESISNALSRSRTNKKDSKFKVKKFSLATTQPAGFAELSGTSQSRATAST